MGSSGSSGSGLFPNGLELKVVLEGEKDPIPLSHIPTDVTFHYLKELLRHSNAQLKEGKSWEDVEFYTDEDFFFPLPDKTTLSGAKILSGQTLYLAYKEDNSPSNQDSREGREFQVIIPMRVRPIKFKDLPPWATVGGLKKLLKSMCEPTEINRRNFWIRKEKDERDMAVPDSVLLSRLKTNVVVVESELNSWEELQKPTKVSFHSCNQCILISVLTVVFNLGLDCCDCCGVDCCRCYCGVCGVCKVQSTGNGYLQAENGSSNTWITIS